MTNDDLLAQLSAPMFKQVEAAVPVPLFVRAMSIAEYDEYEILSVGKDGKKNDWSAYRAKYLCFALCDEQGKRRFSVADIPRIAAIPEPILGPVYLEARRLNGHDKAETTEKKSDSRNGDGNGSNSDSALASESLTPTTSG